MAKQRYAWTEAKIARFTKQRRGGGAGADYKPWLTVQNVPSLGRSHRPLGMTTRRVHHLLSDLEYRAFLDADYDPAVVDIREQFPLDREETRRIASRLDLQHPRDPSTGVEIVMTTDLLVDRTVGSGIVSQPIFVKYANDLGARRTLEKLEIERLYWAERGCSLEIRTEKECPKIRGEVISWIAANHRLDEEPWPEPGYWSRRADFMLAALSATGALTFEQFDWQLRQAGFAIGEPIAVLRHLLARRRLLLDDLEREFRQTDHLSRFLSAPAEWLAA